MTITILLWVQAFGKEQNLGNGKVVFPLRREKGVRLLFHKKPAMNRPTAVWMDIDQVTLPYSCFTDVSVQPAVSLYDTVRRGTPLATCEEDVNAPFISSVTGAVSSERELEHPLYGVLRCAVVDRLPAPPEAEMPAPLPMTFTAEEICAAAETAHIIDELDGVPLALKLRDWHDRGCDCLVADAVQVQPYESSAWAVLRDTAEQVAEGLSLAASVAGASSHHIAVCLSKTRRRSITTRIGKERVFQTDSFYPTTVLARRSKRAAPYTVAPDATVYRIGVQACRALYRALYLHEPHDRVTLTVAGNGVRHPQNVTVPFGTSVQEVLTRCGVMEDPTYLILGDMMTGVTSVTQDIPALPGMTCLLVFSAEVIRHVPSRTCIGCGRCVEVCHADLLPFEIVRRYSNMHYERLSSLDAASCDGCGACSYVCPSGIELAAIIADAHQTDSTLLVDLEEDVDA